VVSQSDFSVEEKTVVETSYGFGIIQAVNAQFGIVKVGLLERGSRGTCSGVTVSLPWSRFGFLLMCLSQSGTLGQGRRSEG